MHNQVFDGFARAIWGSAYASAVDNMVEEGRIRRTPWGSGDDVSTFVPSTPPDLIDRVGLLFESSLDDVKDEVEAAYDAAREERYDAPPDAEEFGWQMGMAWMGEGTAIPDAGRKLLRKLGRGEVHVDVALDRTGAPGKTTVAYASLPEIPSVEANKKRRSRRRHSRRRTSRRR